MESQRSNLEDAERGLGAAFGSFHGWEMARSYSDPTDEHLSVRASAGLIDLSYHGGIKVWGGEAVQFLNGLVSNDVKTLAAGKGMRAAFLTGHGKVRALSRVLNLGDQFLIITEPQTHDKVFKYVSPFSYAGDFKVEDASTEYRLLSVQGPKAHLIMKEVCFEPVPSLAEHDYIQTLIAGHRALVVCASHTGGPGFDILVPEIALRDVWDFLMLKGQFHELIPVGLEAFESLRIEAGLPVYGVDVDETNMLLEVGLEDVVSFTKGCYTGQEAVAMATYRGHVSKKLSGLSIDGDVVPARGDLLQKDGKEIGLVTSSLRSPSLGSVIALGYVKYGFFQIGNTVHVVSQNTILPATVVEVPFIRSLASET